MVRFGSKETWVHGRLRADILTKEILTDWDKACDRDNLVLRERRENRLA